jgi:high-affinity nickel-transport protein
VLINVLDLHGGPFNVVAQLEFGRLGYVIVGLFVLAWGASVAVWKLGGIEERYITACASPDRTRPDDRGKD